jgi:hypothetical protein
MAQKLTVTAPSHRATLLSLFHFNGAFHAPYVWRSAGGASGGTDTASGSC